MDLMEMAKRECEEHLQNCADCRLNIDGTRCMVAHYAPHNLDIEAIRRALEKTSDKEAGDLRKENKEMKKLFISVPMKDRTEEQIKASMNKMHKIAEAVFGEELEVIDTYIDDPSYKDRPIACLGESIKKMQEADYFVGVDCAWKCRGCYIEREMAQRYLGCKKIFTIEDRLIYSKEETEAMEAREGLMRSDEACCPK